MLPPAPKLGKRSINQMIQDRPSRDDKKKNLSSSKNKESKPPLSPAPVVNGDLEKDQAMVCELCGLTFPHPVTYHMKQMHPGCGWHAGGNGYNSGGNYCVGWAGNCGDGGGGGSSWYLLCDTCRDRYLKAKRTKRQRRTESRQQLQPHQQQIPQQLSPITSTPDSDESHAIVKRNAMFLLDLASASGISLPKHQRRPSQTLSAVAENYSPPDTSGPFPSSGPFQCLQGLGIHHTQALDERFYEEALRRENLYVYESGGYFAANGRVSVSWSF